MRGCCSMLHVWKTGQMVMVVMVVVVVVSGVKEVNTAK